MQGKIIRGIGGFYYVHTHQGVYECRARGIFRKDKEKPLPGDLVSISVLDETEKKGNLDEILPRTNSLIRPAVANVDQALVIFALVSPKPNFNLLDRFLVLMEKQGIPALICMNKTDLASDEMIAEVRERYRTSGYPLLFVSAAQKEGIEAIPGVSSGEDDDRCGSQRSRKIVSDQPAAGWCTDADRRSE